MVSEEETSEFVSEVFPLAFLVFFVQVPNKLEFDFSSDDVEEMVHLALDFPIDSNTLNFIHETEKDDDNGKVFKKENNRGYTRSGIFKEEPVII